TEQIQRTEKEIAEKLDKLPDVLKEDGYPDVQAFMATYRKAEAVVEQYNRDLAAWERQVREKQKPAQKEQAKPPERKSVLKRLRQLQAVGRQRSQPKRKSHDRER
ncbi:MAG: MobA/MobL family protein, partial [Firmicutes bacterium]|nr:MobA/MobL family protein [Bacillota bacterium]